MSDVPDVIKAKSFQLVDDDGKTRAELTMEDGVPEFRLLDQEGNTLLSAAVLDDVQPSLRVGRMLGSHLHATVFDGHPSLQLLDLAPGSRPKGIVWEGANGRIDLGFDERGELFLRLLGKQGHLWAEVDPAGNAALTLSDEKLSSKERRTLVTAEGIKKNRDLFGEIK